MLGFQVAIAFLTRGRFRNAHEAARAMKGSSTIGAVSVIAGHGRPELGTESGATFRKRDRPEPRPGAPASMGMTTSTDADDAKRQNGLEHGPGRSALAMGFLPWRPGSAVEGRPENPREALEKVRFAPGNSTATAAVAATMPDETGVSLPARWGGRRPASGPCAAAIVHAVARKIRQKRLKTFDSRPELLTATVAVAATMPDEAGLSRPARWDRRRPTAGATPGHRPCSRPENPPEPFENVRFTPGNLNRDGGGGRDNAG